MDPNFFLRAFYQFWRVLINFCLDLYFGKNVIINRKNLDFKNPCIVVSNHPHTLFDPLVVMSKSPRYSKFLANYSLFKTPFQNWFFTTFYCIPIKRKKDNWGGNLKNEDSMNQAEQHLADGGVIYIAPEGTSKIKRKVRRIKTGAARIAFDAENDNDWNIGLTILPCGNNFETPAQFRAPVIVNVGEPIKVADFRVDFENDPSIAIRKLSDCIGERLSDLTFDFPTVEEDRMSRYLEEVLKTESPNDSTETMFYKRKTLAISILKLKKENPDSFEKLKSKSFKYGNHLRAWRISDRIFKTPSSSFLTILGMIISFPLCVGGAVNNFFVYVICKFLPQRFNDFTGYVSTGRVLMGLIVVPIFYGLQTWLIYHFSKNGWLALGYFLLLIPTGLFAWYWKEALKVIFKKIGFSKIRKIKKDQIEELQKLRNQLKIFVDQQVFHD